MLERLTWSCVCSCLVLALFLQARLVNAESLATARICQAQKHSLLCLASMRSHHDSFLVDLESQRCRKQLKKPGFSSLEADSAGEDARLPTFGYLV